jgi:gluconate:H+ symporter, GntP family
MVEGTVIIRSSKRHLLPDLPLVIWIILITLLLGLLAGKDATALIGAFNAGYGASIGDFALILIPSFVLAAAIEQRRIVMSSAVSVGIAPFAAAAMVCPDTAYAALSPMCRTRKLPMAFGAFAGFKLLFPAGPLIVATSLGADPAVILMLCALVFVPVWAFGLLFGHLVERRLGLKFGQTAATGGLRGRSLVALLPFVVLAVLLVAGMVFDFGFNVWLDFLTDPKGALLAAAAAALAMLPQGDQRGVVDKGLRRAAALLIIIGSASAFSRILTQVVPVHAIFADRTGTFAVFSVFLLTALFKLLQGSSMSTFAAVGPVAAPIVAASGASPAVCVMAICLGSFIAILPNDSFYWLVRQDAMPDQPEATAIATLAAGSTLQALAGFGVLLLLATVNAI